MKELEDHVKSYQWLSGPFEQAPAGSLWKYRKQFMHLLIRKDLIVPGSDTINQDCFIIKLGIEEKGPANINGNGHKDNCSQYAAYEKIMYVVNDEVKIGWITQVDGNRSLSRGKQPINFTPIEEQ